MPQVDFLILMLRLLPVTSTTTTTNITLLFISYHVVLNTHGVIVPFYTECRLHCNLILTNTLVVGAFRDVSLVNGRTLTRLGCLVLSSFVHWLSRFIFFLTAQTLSLIHI